LLVFCYTKVISPKPDRLPYREIHFALPWRQDSKAKLISPYQVKAETLLPPALTLSLSQRERGEFGKETRRLLVLRRLFSETAFFYTHTPIPSPKFGRGAQG